MSAVRYRWAGAAAAALVLAGCTAGTGHAARSAPPTRTARAAALAAPATPTAAPVTTPAITPAITPASTPRASTAPAGPCATTRAQRVVVVSVRQQHLWMCAGHRTVRDTPVTTGAVDLPYDSTPIGTFHVQGRDRGTTLTLNTGAQYTVAYWIPFDAPLFGFHDAPWQRFAYGSDRYRTRGSHGCVHMPLAQIRFLYGWVRVGTTVSIRA